MSILQTIIQPAHPKPDSSATCFEKYAQRQALAFQSKYSVNAKAAHSAAAQTELPLRNVGRQSAIVRQA